MLSTEPKPCPRCGSLSDHLSPIDAGMRLALQSSGGSAIPSEVCPACYDRMTEEVSHGVKLRMEDAQRERNKVAMWKSRVVLLKNARALMAQKSFSEAAEQYEKYLRVLEMVYNIEKGQLTPRVFNDSLRSKELMVVASVYWDLMRIYDADPGAKSRLAAAGKKLAEFLPYSALYPEVVRQAETLAHTTNNPEIFFQLVRDARAERGSCFIATAAFRDEPDASELYWLRRFRDKILRPHPLGRRMIWLYYRYSPILARQVSRRERLRRTTRWVLRKIVVLIKKNLNSP